jgi:hypothetical protein
MHADQEGDCASGTGRPDFAGQLSCWCRWLQHTAGTPEYIPAFSLHSRSASSYVDFLFMSIDNATVHPHGRSCLKAAPSPQILQQMRDEVCS